MVLLRERGRRKGEGQSQKRGKAKRGKDVGESKPKRAAIWRRPSTMSPISTDIYTRCLPVGMVSVGGSDYLEGHLPYPPEKT